MNEKKGHIIILGGGFVGLRLAYLVSRGGYNVTLVEKCNKPGGMVQTFIHNYEDKDFLFDFGPHLFFREYRDQYEDLIGDDLETLTDCFQMYTRHALLTYPLKPMEMLFKINPFLTAYYLLNFFAHKFVFSRGASSDDLQAVMTKRFGSKLFKEFYAPYIEKCCGLSPADTSAAWALERENVSGKSLGDNIVKKIFSMLSSKVRKRLEAKNDPAAENITAWYPAFGSGQICDAMAARLPEGAVWINSEVVSVNMENNHVGGVSLRRDGKVEELQGDYYISTIPLPELAGMMTTSSDDIKESIKQLEYRMVRLVNLIINKPRVLDSLEVFSMDEHHLFKRVYEPKAMSKRMAPEDMTSLSLEVCCSAGDDVSSMPASDLAVKCAEQLVDMDILDSIDEMVDSFVVDMPRAYPVYRRGFEKHRDALRDTVSGIDNLVTTGRQGVFRYHAMTNEVMEMADHVVDFLGSKDRDKKASYTGSLWGQSFY